MVKNNHYFRSGEKTNAEGDSELVNQCSSFHRSDGLCPELKDRTAHGTHLDLRSGHEDGVHQSWRGGPLREPWRNAAIPVDLVGRSTKEAPYSF